VKRKKKIPRQGEPPAALRIIRKPEVERLTGYSGVQIWRLEGKGLFPQRVQLSPTGMAVGWYEHEILQWVQSRVRQGGKRPPVQWRGGPSPLKADEADKAHPTAQSQQD